MDKRKQKESNISTEPLSLKANMLWNSAGSLVYFGFQWLLTIAVVRIAGNYEQAGILALAMAVYNIVSPFSIYRMYTYQISDVNHENTLGEYLTFRMITTIAALALAFAYSLCTCPLYSVLPAILYLVYRFASQLIDVLHGAMQLNNRMDYIGISNAMQGLASFIAFCAVFYATRSLELAFACMIVCIVLVGLLYDLPRAASFESIDLGISMSKAKHLLVYCFPVVIAAIACSAVPSVPRQYLAVTQGEALLGIYTSIAAPAAIIQMGASYVYNPLLGTFAIYYVDDKPVRFIGLFRKVTIGIVGVGLASCLILGAIGEWLLILLFGNSIADHAYLLIPVIICASITAFVWFLNDLLVGIRNFKGAVIGNMCSLVASLALTAPLIDKFGPNGISFASIIAYCFGLLFFILFLTRSISDMKKKGLT